MISGAVKFVVGNLAFQIGREIHRTKPRGLCEIYHREIDQAGKPRPALCHGEQWDGKPGGGAGMYWNGRTP